MPVSCMAYATFRSVKKPDPSSSSFERPETLGGWAGRSGDHAAHHGTRPPIGSLESPRSRRLLEIKHRAGALPGAAGETGAALRLRKRGQHVLSRTGCYSADMWDQPQSLMFLIFR